MNGTSSAASTAINTAAEPLSEKKRGTLWVRFADPVSAEIHIVGPDIDSDTETEELSSDDDGYVEESKYRPDSMGFRSPSIPIAEWTNCDDGPLYAIPSTSLFDAPEVEFSLGLREITPETIQDAVDRLVPDLSSEPNVERRRLRESQQAKDEEVYLLGLDCAGEASRRVPSPPRSLEISQSIGRNKVRFFRHTCGESCQCPDSQKRIGCNQVSSKKRPSAPRNRPGPKGKRSKKSKNEENH